ncbi:hypothetical protein FRC06_007337, partial [Ceratobasidium sp. 370]
MKNSSKRSSYTSPFGETVVQSYETLRFPSSIKLTRFGVYSPFVRVLRTTEPFSANSPGGLPNFGARTSPVGLLPNLERLVIYTHEYINWVSRLLAPNLREIKMLLTGQEDSTGPDGYTQHAELHPDAYPDLIDKIVNTYPQLEALQIFFSATASNIRPGVEYIVSLSWPIIDILSNLHLRSLNLGGVKFDLNPAVYKISDAGMQQNQPEIKWEHFLTTVPYLEALKLESQHVTLQELRTITTVLPRLRLLSLALIQLTQALGAPGTVI